MLIRNFHAPKIVDINEVILSEAGDNDDDENRDTPESLGRWGSFQKLLYFSKRMIN